MRRHGVLRHPECLGDITGSEPLRLVLRQQAKHVEPGRLGKRRQREDSLFRIHISRVMDILEIVNRLFPGAIRAYWSPRNGYVVFPAIALTLAAATASRSITCIKVVKP